MPVNMTWVRSINRDQIKHVLLFLLAALVYSIVAFLIGETKRQFNEAVRQLSGVTAYGLAYVGAGLGFLGPPEAKCYPKNGGVFEANPSRLSDRGFKNHMICLGLSDGYIDEEKISIQAYYFLAACIIGYFTLPTVAKYLATCVLGGKIRKLEAALAKAHLGGIAFAEASCRSTIKKLELAITDLEAKAAFCGRNHTDETAIRAYNFERVNKILRDDVARLNGQSRPLERTINAMRARIASLEALDATALQEKVVNLEQSRASELATRDEELATLRRELEEVHKTSRAAAQRCELVDQQQQRLESWESELLVAQGAHEAVKTEHASTVATLQQELIEASASRDLAETALKALEKSSADQISMESAEAMMAELDKLREWSQFDQQTAAAAEDELAALREFRDKATTEHHRLMGDCQAELNELLTWKATAIAEVQDFQPVHLKTLEKVRTLTAELQNRPDIKALEQQIEMLTSKLEEQPDTTALQRKVETMIVQLREQALKHKEKLTEFALKSKNERDEAEKKRHASWKEMHQKAVKNKKEFLAQKTAAELERDKAVAKQAELTAENVRLTKRVESLRDGKRAASSRGTQEATPQEANPQEESGRPAVRSSKRRDREEMAPAEEHHYGVIPDHDQPSTDDAVNDFMKFGPDSYRE